MCLALLLYIHIFCSLTLVILHSSIVSVSKMHSDVSPCPKLPGPVKSPLHIRVAETPRPVSMLPQGQETTALSPIPVTGQTSTRPPGCNVMDSIEQASKEPYK